jgi:hypothetical protein
VLAKDSSEQKADNKVQRKEITTMEKSITPTDGQIRQTVTAIRSVTPVCVLTALHQMVDDGEITREKLQLALGRGNQLKRRMIPAVKEWVREMSREEDLLRRITGTVIPQQSKFPLSTLWENKIVKMGNICTAITINYHKYVEDAVGETEIEISGLQKWAKLSDITSEFIPLRKAITYSQIYWLLTQQPKGEQPDGLEKLLMADGSKSYIRVRNYQQWRWSSHLVSVHWEKGWNLVSILHESTLEKSAQVIYPV